MSTHIHTSNTPDVQSQLTSRLIRILRETGPRMHLLRPRGVRITRRDLSRLYDLGLIHAPGNLTLTQRGSDLAMHLAGYGDTPTPPAVCEIPEYISPEAVATRTMAPVIDLATVRAGRDTLRSAWTEAQFRLRRGDGGPAARERREQNESIRRRLKEGTFHGPRS